MQTVHIAPVPRVGKRRITGRLRGDSPRPIPETARQIHRRPHASCKMILVDSTAKAQAPVHSSSSTEIAVWPEVRFSLKLLLALGSGRWTSDRRVLESSLIAPWTKLPCGENSPATPRHHKPRLCVQFRQCTHLLSLSWFARNHLLALYTGRNAGHSWPAAQDFGIAHSAAPDGVGSRHIRDERQDAPTSHPPSEIFERSVVVGGVGQASRRA